MSAPASPYGVPGIADCAGTTVQTVAGYPTTLPGILVVAIAFSRLYLGAHWFSDVLGGASVGLFWVTLLGIAYDRHPAPALATGRLLGVTAILLVAAGSWHARESGVKTELAQYTPRDTILRVTRATWSTSSWETFPAFCIDLEGRNNQPLNFQWAGSLQTLRTVLTQAGWHPAPVLSPLTAINWLVPKPAIGELPVLPEVNDGQHQQFLLIGPPGRDDRRLVVLRLWSSHMQLLDNKQSVWVGKVNYLYLEDNLPLITYLRSAPDYSTPLQILASALRQGARVRLAARNRDIHARGLQWNGEVLLAWEPPHAVSR